MSASASRQHATVGGFHRVCKHAHHALGFVTDRGEFGGRFGLMPLAASAYLPSCESPPPTAVPAELRPRHHCDNPEWGRSVSGDLAEPVRHARESTLHGLQGDIRRPTIRIVNEVGDVVPPFPDLGQDWLAPSASVLT
jgi:hypothetical protein